MPVGGSTEQVEVETVQKEMTLDLSCADFDLQAVKQSLADQYKVDVALISLEDPCARRRRLHGRSLQGLTLTITIATSATAEDGSVIEAPPMEDLLSAVEQIDDSALGSSLGSALGAGLGACHK